MSLLDRSAMPDKIAATMCESTVIDRVDPVLEELNP